MSSGTSRCLQGPALAWTCRMRLHMNLECQLAWIWNVKRHEGMTFRDVDLQWKGKCASDAQPPVKGSALSLTHTCTYENTDAYTHMNKYTVASRKSGKFWSFENQACKERLQRNNGRDPKDRVLLDGAEEPSQIWGASECNWMMWKLK